MACQKICSGDLRHEVSVQGEIKTDDGAGGDTITWVEKFKIMCGMRQRTAGEKLMQQDLRSHAVVVFSCRYRADILTTDKLVFGSEDYNIHSIDNLEFKNKWLVMNAERNVPQ